MTAMTGAQELEPCVLCPTRMAVPGSLFCVPCTVELTTAEVTEVDE